MWGIDWTAVFERCAVMAPACFFHIRIALSSRRSRIPNSDVLWLLFSGLLFSTYYAFRNGAFSPHVAAVNAAFLVLAALGAWRFSGPAYAKYLFASGVPFLFFGSVARFVALSVLVVFVAQAVSALAFYVRTSVSGGLFGFLKKHFSESAANGSKFSPSSVLRHALAFLTMVVAVRIAQHFLLSGYALPHLWLTPEELSLALTMSGMAVSWLVFSRKERLFKGKGAAVVFLLLAAALGHAVSTMGLSAAASLFFQALAMYAFVWAARGILSFHSTSDGAKFVAYDAVRPGDLVDKKFLFRFLADFQYDEAWAKSLVNAVSGGVSKEWIDALNSHVEAATRSALERKLPGFSARTEILVLRRSSLVPHIAVSALSCMAAFPHSPAHFFR